MRLKDTGLTAEDIKAKVKKYMIEIRPKNRADPDHGFSTAD